MKQCLLYLWLICVWMEGNATPLSWEQTAPGGFSVHVELSDTKMTLLDQLTVTVNATFPAEYQVDWNALKSHLLFETGFSETVFQLTSQTITPQKGIFVLSPLVTGKHAVTFLNMPFISKDAPTHRPVEIISDIFEVDISMPASATEKVSLAPLLSFNEEFPVDANAKNRRALEQQLIAANNVQVFKEREIPWIGLVTLAAAFALLFTAKKSIPFRLTQQPISTKQLALESLQNAHDLLQQKLYDTYYTMLSQILRHYIESNYHVAAEAKTTEEFLHEIAMHPIFSEETQEAFKAFLQKADRVKYGHMPTTEKEAEEAFHLALNFIEKGP